MFAAFNMLSRLEISLDAVSDVIGIVCCGDGEAQVVCLAEIIKPIQEICHCFGRAVIKKLIEIIYENVGDIIVAGVQPADKTTKKIVSVDTIFACVNQACGIGYIISEVLVFLYADYIAIFLGNSLYHKVNKSFGFAGAFKTHNKLNHCNHAPFVLINA